MSKTISPSLLTHVRGEVTTLAYLWKIVRRDTQEFYFTSHDQDITYLGHTYEAAAGFIASAIDQSRGLSVDNLEAQSFLDSEKITEAVRAALNNIAAKIEECRNKILMLYQEDGAGDLFA